MGLFSKKRDVVDLTDRYFKQQEKLKAIQEQQAQSGLVSNVPSQLSQDNSFGFFGSMANVGNSNSSNNSSDEALILSTDNTDDKRKKLAKRILDMTTKIEELSNQIYHLQQRVEVLERKNNSY